MQYPQVFTDKMRAALMDAPVPAAHDALRAMENNEKSSLGMILEKLVTSHYSPEEIQQLFAAKNEQEILLMANLAVTCRDLLKDWNVLYQAQKPINYPLLLKK